MRRMTHREEIATRIVCSLLREPDHMTRLQADKLGARAARIADDIITESATFDRIASDKAAAKLASDQKAFP